MSEKQITKAMDALTLACGRCGHQWLRRSLAVPKQCPLCKSKQWNRERERDLADEYRAAPAAARKAVKE